MANADSGITPDSFDTILVLDSYKPNHAEDTYGAGLVSIVAGQEGAMVIHLGVGHSSVEGAYRNLLRTMAPMVHKSQKDIFLTNDQVKFCDMEGFLVDEDARAQMYQEIARDRDHESSESASDHSAKPLKKERVDEKHYKMAHASDLGQAKPVVQLKKEKMKDFSDEDESENGFLSPFRWKQQTPEFVFSAPKVVSTPPKIAPTASSTVLSIEDVQASTEKFTQAIKDKQSRIDEGTQAIGYKQAKKVEELQALKDKQACKEPSKREKRAIKAEQARKDEKTQALKAEEASREQSIRDKRANKEAQALKDKQSSRDQSIKDKQPGSPSKKQKKKDKKR